MLKKKKPQNDPLEQLGYETSDVSVTALSGAVIGLFIFVGFASAVSLGFYYAFVPKEPAAETQALQTATAAKRLPPEEYRVQGYPIPDMIRFREQENKELASYAWKDKAKGAVQIDVERAIDLAVERGIPEPKPKTPASPGQTVPTNATPTGGTVPNPGNSVIPDTTPRTTNPAPNTPEQTAPNSPSPNAGAMGTNGAGTGATTDATGSARKE